MSGIVQDCTLALGGVRFDLALDLFGGLLLKSTSKGIHNGANWFYCTALTVWGHVTDTTEERNENRQKMQYLQSCGSDLLRQRKQST